MDSRLHILRHSLGLDQNGFGKQHRNYFCTSEGSEPFNDCRALVADGLMTERSGNALSVGDSIFHVTPNGMNYVAQNSQKIPRIKKSDNKPTFCHKHG